MPSGQLLPNARPTLSFLTLYSLTLGVINRCCEIVLPVTQQFPFAILFMQHEREDGIKTIKDQPNETFEPVSQLADISIGTPPPDGGYGWVCTVAAATINAHSWSFNLAYAVFLTHYLKNNTFPGATSFQYALVGL